MPMAAEAAGAASKSQYCNPILYQNSECTVTLIDVPASITHAQGAQRRVASTVPLSEPYTSTEPRSQKARDKVLAKHKSSDSESDTIQAITTALDCIKQEHQGLWILPRLTLDCKDHTGSLRKAADAIRLIDGALSILFQAILTSNKLTALFQSQQLSTALEIQDHWDGTWYNDGDTAISLTFPGTSSWPSYTVDSNNGSKPILHQPPSFVLPAGSSIILSDCGRVDKFRNHVKWVAQEYDLSKQFDFILLDPPWENVSAKRRTAYGTGGVETLLSGMDLGSYLCPAGLVGIWITNKRSIREMVLGEGGIFDTLNVGLVEEWVWIKVTATGAPVTQLDGIWRKPYEVLLLGKAPASRLQLASPADIITRRVLAGAPDFHSRKPCLKTLIEPLLPAEPRVLEVFARYLVEGWTSWGNEVLKYNYEGYFEDP